MKNPGVCIMDGRGIRAMIDRKDKELLNLIQSGFPMEPRPFLALANQLDLTEDEVIERIRKLKENGYINRLGGIFDSGKLGFFSTLCAIKVPEDRIEDVAEIINSYEGITHNYIRKHSYNMWFTMIAPSAEEIEENLVEIRTKTGINNVINLPAVRLFKIKVNFDMKGVQADV